MAFDVVIEEIEDIDAALVVASCELDDVVAMANDMYITKLEVIDALLLAHDGLS